MIGSNDKQQVNFINPLLTGNFGDIIEWKPILNSDFKMIVNNKKLNYLDIVLTDDENNMDFPYIEDFGYSGFPTYPIENESRNWVISPQIDPTWEKTTERGKKRSK